MTSPQNTLELGDALRTLAVMGDLNMGQPIDHSQRVAQPAIVATKPRNFIK